MFTCKLLKIFDDVLQHTVSVACFMILITAHAATLKRRHMRNLMLLVRLAASHVLVFTRSVDRHLLRLSLSSNSSMGNSLHLQSEDINSEELLWRNRRNQCRDKASHAMSELNITAYDRSVYYDVLALDITLSSSASSKACRSTVVCLVRLNLEVLLGKV